MFSCLFKVCLLQKLKCQGTVICQQILMIDKLFSFLSLVAFLLLGSGWQEEVIEMIVIANLWNKRYNSDSDGNRDSRLQDRELQRERKCAALISIVCVVPQISEVGIHLIIIPLPTLSVSQ